MNDFEIKAIVFVGKYQLKNGKVGVAILLSDRLNEITDECLSLKDEELGFDISRERKMQQTIDREASLFAEKGSKLSVIGGTYFSKVKVDGEKIISIVSSETKFQGPSNHPLTMAWEADARALNTVIRAEAEEKKAATNSELMKHVRALQFAVSNMSPTNKNAFRLFVYNEIGKR